MSILRRLLSPIRNLHGVLQACVVYTYTDGGTIEIESYLRVLKHRSRDPRYEAVEIRDLLVGLISICQFSPDHPSLIANPATVTCTPMLACDDLLDRLSDSQGARLKEAGAAEPVRVVGMKGRDAPTVDISININQAT